VEAHYFLGVALVMKGRRAEGLAHWRQALRKEPDNVQVLNETAWVLATDGGRGAAQWSGGCRAG
jgi:cytochrome c-type biogenesis protein CcmH/NrfG